MWVEIERASPSVALLSSPSVKLDAPTTAVFPETATVSPETATKRPKSSKPLVLDALR